MVEVVLNNSGSLRLMRFAEIASRLTGISTPIFGISWNPPTPDIEVARRVLIFLESRRVLYNPLEVEVPEQCVESVLEIRRFLTQVLADQGMPEELTEHLRAMRAACRRFLDRFGSGDGKGKLYLPSSGYWDGVGDWRLNQALGELRTMVGLHVAQIAVKYGLDVEGQLAFMLPLAPDDPDD